jgi:hypothetical protein
MEAQMPAATDHEPFANSELYVSVHTPESYDAAGYTVLGWVSIGLMLRAIKPVKEAPAREKMGSFKLPTTEIEIAWSEPGDGLSIVAAAMSNRATLSFKLVKRNGTSTHYFPAQVESVAEDISGTHGAIGFLRQRDAVTDSTLMVGEEIS